MPTATLVRASRKRSQRDTVRSCAFCAVPIPDGVSHAILSPCKCTVCLECLLETHAKRGVKLCVCQCSKGVKSHRIVKADQTVGAAVEYETAQESYIKRELPLTFLKKQLGRQLANATTDTEILVLYCSTIKKQFVRGGNYNYYLDGVVQTLMLDLHGLTYTNESCQRLSEFFSFLYPRIVPPQANLDDRHKYLP